MRLTYYSSMKKKFRKIRMIFDVENSLWKSNFLTLRRAGKAMQSIPGCLWSGRMANFVSTFEKWGHRRCHFRPSRHYSACFYVSNSQTLLCAIFQLQPTHLHITYYISHYTCKSFFDLTCIKSVQVMIRLHIFLITV